MSSERLSKWVFYGSLAVLALALSFGWGALAYRNALPPIPQLKTAHATLFASEGVTVPARSFHLQPTRDQGAGVTRNTVSDDALVLLSGFFDAENQIRLIARDGTVLRKWSLDYFAHFPDAGTRPCDLASALHTDVHGAILTPQGGVVFNYEYCGTVKLDQCGAVAWTIAAPTHHSVIPAEAGGYWILGRLLWSARDMPERFAPFSLPPQTGMIAEDTLMRVTEDGTILSEQSIPQMMRANGLEALLSAGHRFVETSAPRTELVHANKAAELTSDRAAAFPLFAAGDIAISMRQLNLVMVLDPATQVIKWHQTGPWLRQHDPEFRTDGKISIFNNNVYLTAYDRQQTDLATPFVTHILEVDPVSGQTEITYGQAPGQEMLSVIRGQHELLPQGGLLITEFDAGRVLQVDAGQNIVWEYVNRYDDRFVGEIANAAVYPPAHVTEAWRDCGALSQQKEQ